jgi:hypothetical protein
MRMTQRTLRGRPPFLPLARDAAAFVSDVTLPPFRPSATAAGFLRAIIGSRQSVIGRERSVVGIACRPHLTRRGLRLTASLFIRSQRDFCGLLGGGDLCRKRLCHRQIVPDRLGYVNWAGIGRLLLVLEAL